MHLTNYSINKKNEYYKFVDKSSANTDTSTSADEEAVAAATTKPENAGEGSKRKLTTVFNYMHANGYNVAKIKSQIDDLVVKTVVALLPELKVNCAFEPFNKPYRQKSTYFQVGHIYFFRIY